MEKWEREEIKDKEKRIKEEMGRSESMPLSLIHSPLSRFSI